MPVDEETKQVLKLLDQFSPETSDPPAFLIPYIIDYMPAVGEADAFLKIPRPDKETEKLGIYQLDE